MQDFTMVIPTYWGNRGDDLLGSEKIVFDHPTPLDEEGTLGRFLESLAIFNDFGGTVVIISVANSPEIAKEVEKRVDEIIAPFRQCYDIINFGQSNLDKIIGRLSGKGVSEECLDLIQMDSYAKVRNLCSLAGILNDSSRTIFIDDDEVFTDKDFLKKVEDSMGRSVGAERIEALAGYYLQPETYILDESKVPIWRRPCWNNAAVMNEAFEEIIGKGDRLKATPFVFGGNMTLSQEVAMKVPFDPKITRGEDIDFLINLRINGIKFYLDRELSIKHLPPSSEQKAWKKVREDCIRFLYERKKIRDHVAVLPIADLMPYPGTFLTDDLNERIVKTAELLKGEFAADGDAEGVSECDKIIEIGRNAPYMDFDTVGWLEKITADWQKLTKAAKGMGIS